MIKVKMLKSTFPKKLRIGIVQMRSTADVWQNLLLVQSFIELSKYNNCDLLCFPENVFYRGPNKPKKFKKELITLQLSKSRELIEHSEFSKALAESINDLDFYVSFGGLWEKSDSGLPYNSHWLVTPYKTIHSYKKMHLFSYNAKNSYNEANSFSKGEHVNVVSIPPWNITLSICYDLRFPELYRNATLQKGSNIILAPAAFVHETGKMHWHTLNKSKAIENQSYVIASAQWGAHKNDQNQSCECWGNSLSFDPWGKELSHAETEGDSLDVVEVSIDRVKKVRAKMPCLNNTHSKLKL